MIYLNSLRPSAKQPVKHLYATNISIVFGVDITEYSNRLLISVEH